MCAFPTLGDYALPSQAMECIRLIDVDGDGRIGLWDYINFAARLKELHQVSCDASWASKQAYKQRADEGVFCFYSNIITDRPTSMSWSCARSRSEQLNSRMWSGPRSDRELARTIVVTQIGVEQVLISTYG